MRLNFTGIRFQLFAAIVLFTIVPIICITAYISVKLETEMSREFADATSREITQVDNGINIYLSTISENAVLLSESPVVKSANNTLMSYVDKKSDEGSVKMTPSKNGGIEEQIYREYERYGNAHPGAAYVYMATVSGGYVQWPEGGIFNNYDPRTRLFYKKAMENPGKPVMTSPYYFATDDAVIVSTAKTIKDGTGNIIGVQGLDVSLKGLTDIIKNIKIGKEGYIILLDGEGTILANPCKPELNFKKVNDLNFNCEEDISKTADGVFPAKVDGEEILINSYVSKTTGWRYLAVIKKSEVLEMAKDIEKVLLIIAIGFVFLAILVSALYSRRFIHPLNLVQQHCKRLESGDFTQLLPEFLIKRKDEYGVLAIGLNTMQSTIAALVREIQQVAQTLSISADNYAGIANETSKAADEISAAVQEIANSVQNEAANVLTGAQNLHELSQTMDKVHNQSVELTAMTEKTVDLSGQGIESVKMLGEKSRDLKKAFDIANATIQEMDKMSDEIGVITSAIGQIAEQTNLLALNAAIEAARAGESGRGFAVVAEEVRNLAEQSAKSTQNIRGLIGKIQEQSKVAVGGMEDVYRITAEQNVAVGRTEGLFGQIAEQIAMVRNNGVELEAMYHIMVEHKNNLLDIINSISAVMNQTAASTEEVAASAVEQTAGMEEFADKIIDLRQMTHKLDNGVSQFKV